MTVTAIFDIGKTNKKFCLFDENRREVYHTYAQFETVADDDGDPAENLPALEQWVRDTLTAALNDPAYTVRAVNFSTYGASFVHVGRHGRPVVPLYNYLKPYPDAVLQAFYRQYGEPQRIARETASPPLGMLNSGLQLYWLKHAKPALFEQLRWSLHLPQYLSYRCTGIPLSDYTSIGCHTALWDAEKNDYHQWVYAEELDRVLAPIVPTDTCIHTRIAGKRLAVGVGIHDSSAALLPYLHTGQAPFLVLSTGTWNIALNPFSAQPLTDDDLRHDCLHYLRPDGKPVRACRLFLGHEYQQQVDKLRAHFGRPAGAHHTVVFDERLCEHIRHAPTPAFRFEHLPAADRPDETQLGLFPDFETACHRLVWELTGLQEEAVRRAMGQTPAKTVYLDGGFAGNPLFTRMLALRMPDCAIIATETPLGSAEGAARALEFGI